MIDGKNQRLHAYMRLIVGAALPLITLTGVQLFDRVGPMSAHDWTISAVFAAVLIIGEMYPIPVARGQEAGDEITVSSTFGLALVLVAPVCIAVAAQGVALVVDCWARKRPTNRLPFNIAQYSLAFIAARGAYCLVSGSSFIPGSPIQKPLVIPSLVAAAVFLLVNNLLVAIAIAESLNQRLRSVLLGDLRWQAATSAPLLGLAPVAVAAMEWSVVSIVLLLLPIVALHQSARLAMRREQEALRDALTGLANRAMITPAADRALKSGIDKTAMLLIDLDHFKDINDTLGHAAGDDLLKVVADRLRAAARPDDLVGRLGGDEFVILMRSIEDAAAATSLASQVCTTIREPIHVDGMTLAAGCSIGIALGPDHAATVPDLLRCADIALYSAKATRDVAVVYSKEADPHSTNLLRLQADLRAALNNPDSGEIWVAFQPQLNLGTGTITSVECLARWQHPELGLVDPDTFVPIAESTSLIDALLARVLDSALCQLSRWDLDGFHLVACINLSTRQIADIDLPEVIHTLLRKHGISPDRLVLEVTESRLMADPERSAAILAELKAMAIEISIDDFGTGYSSLGYLQRLAVDELKIDRSFVAELTRGGDDTIVRSTIDLGHNLGLRVVAEGVEDRATAERLADMGCDLLQGYLIGRPAAAEDVTAYLPGTVRALVVDRARRRVRDSPLLGNSHISTITRRPATHRVE